MCTGLHATATCKNKITSQALHSVSNHAGQAVGSGGHCQSIGIGAVSKPATDGGGNLAIREISVAGHDPLRQTNLCRMDHAWRPMTHVTGDDKSQFHGSIQALQRSQPLANHAFDPDVAPLPRHMEPRDQTDVCCRKQRFVSCHSHGRLSSLIFLDFAGCDPAGGHDLRSVGQHDRRDSCGGRSVLRRQLLWRSGVRNLLHHDAALRHRVDRVAAGIAAKCAGCVWRCDPVPG